MNHLLVTGGAGFIGSNFVRYMLKKYPHLKITNLDALTYAGNLDNLKDIESDARYRFVHGDICDEKKVAEAMEGCDAVVNFAAETHVDRSIHAGDLFVMTNVKGVYVLCEEARRRKVERFLHISTDEVYGSRLEGYFKETDPLSPSSPYSSAKAGGELLARSYFVTYGLPVLITRSSNNFGPYQYPEKLVPLFVTNLIENKPVPVYGDGKQVRDWLFVEDQCDGLDLVLQKGEVGEIYNCGSHNEEYNIDVTHAILKLLSKGEELITYVQDRPGHDRRYAVDTEKIQKLGWVKKHNFMQGLEKTVKWYLEHEAWWRDIKLKQADYKAWMEKHYKPLERA